MPSRNNKNKAASSPFVGSIGSLLIALTSFVIEHRVIFFLFPLMAMAGGGGTAFVALKNPEVASALGLKRIPTMAIGSLAAPVGLISLLLYFVF